MTFFLALGLRVQLLADRPTVGRSSRQTVSERTREQERNCNAYPPFLGRAPLLARPLAPTYQTGKD